MAGKVELISTGHNNGYLTFAAFDGQDHVKLTHEWYEQLLASYSLNEEERKARDASDARLREVLAKLTRMQTPYAFDV